MIYPDVQYDLKDNNRINLYVVDYLSCSSVQFMFLESKVERFRGETQLSHRLVPHGLVTFDIKLVKDAGQEEGSHVLDNLVTHALSLAERKGLEVAWFPEAIFSEESARIVIFRLVPVLFIEMHVMIVDPDNSVGLNLVS